MEEKYLKFRSQFSYLRNTLIDQKSPFHSVKKLHVGVKQTHRHTDITTYRLNQPRGRFSENRSPPFKRKMRPVTAAAVAGST